MSILTQYRERLHFKNVEQGIYQQKKSAGHFTGLAKVGILLDATDETIKKTALNFIAQLKKEAGDIQILGYVDRKEIKEELPFDSFCKKDLDWLWRPKDATTNQFKAQSYDLLINLCQTDCFSLEYLAISTNANYKIGALTDYPNNYDLMLDSKNLGKYLEQVNFFLVKFSN
ncbi:MAG: hypothetical protein AB8G86_26335 [Saprospiraceae bacterium]